MLPDKGVEVDFDKELRTNFRGYNTYTLKIISKKYGLGSVTNRPTTNFLVY